tara:strand:- start:7514 stop:8269 length:756 start_codon:yes stop_codon:yes gene_type:complete
MLKMEKKEYDIKNQTGLSISRLSIPKDFDEKSFNLFLKQKKSRMPSMFDGMGIFLDVTEIRDLENYKEIFKSASKILKENLFIVSGVLNPKDSQKDFFKNEEKVAVFFSFNEGNSEVKEKVIEKVVEIEKIVEVEKVIEKESSNGGLKIYEGIVRGGEKLYAKGESLLIIGSVKPNAEVIADGNIIVLGKLEGKAIAGGSDKIDAFVIAKEMKPSLLSIAGNFKVLEEDSSLYGSNIKISFNGKVLVSEKI